MAGTVVGPLVCPQGHGPGVPGSRFCTMCGSGLVASTVLAPQPAAAGPLVGATGQPLCKVCGANGVALNPAENVCSACGWLRPLMPGYQLDRSVFLWAQDGQAMSKLQSISALHAVVRTVSDKVGRPWIESTFNAIRLGPRQLPDVWNQAVLAARILGLPHMPDVYISGDQMWNTYTYGTETNSFIVLGTSHLINFAGDELLFVLAREMGHCRAGHALWNTVLRFIAGDVSVHSGLLSNGLINAINPTKLIQGAIDLPLMAWSRQSDVTADRAGLLAVGDEALVRRVLLAWAVRSARLLQQVNIEEWLKQEDESNDQMTRFSEMTTSSSMYTTRRLRLLGQAAKEPELMRWSQSIQPVRRQLAPVAMSGGFGMGTVRKASAGGAPRHASGPAHTAQNAVVASHDSAAAAKVGPLEAVKPAAAARPAVAPSPTDSIRVICNKCKAAMRVPLAVLRGKTQVNVRCPQCSTVLTLRAKLPPGLAASGSAAAADATAKSVVLPATAAAEKSTVVPMSPAGEQD